VKVLVVVLVLLLFVAAPVGGLNAEPFCDLALDSGKFIDWLVCMVFAMILDEGVGDGQGGYTWPWM